MQAADLIRELEAMPQDFPVHFWANGQRREIIEARNVGDCVDLYEEDDQHEADTRADLLDALYLALPFVEDHEQSDIYKTGAVSRALITIRAAIKQAEATQ